ncbi:ubiquinol-cytochrome-c reductase complex assembly factor 1 [Biomphalaria glabrata]|nr:ubiquinol-cytochrome-c reductase complex assembly factor 1 [Biomphalaria glabrata]
MNIAARTNLVTSLKLVYQPLCTGCARRLLAPAICTKIRHLKASQHTASNNFMSAMSTWDKFKWNLGLTGRLSVSKQKLISSGVKLYICCSDFIDFSEFVRVVKLPDTFTSWFLLVNLHLWMVNVKVSQMGKEGELMKTNMYKAMWNDVERRLNTFKDMTGREKRKSLENYYSDMISSILYYDEGLIGADKDLANSLWVQLFCMEPNIHVDQLEIMVEYVRKQVYHHDQLDPDLIMKTGYVSFLPLLGEKLNLQKADQDFKKLCEI